jgi:Protein of unknown function (DUF964).
LKNCKEGQEYLKLKEIIQEDREIQTLLYVIHNTQIEAKEALKANDITLYHSKVQTLNVLKEEFHKNPIIVNYMVAKKDMSDLLEQIASIISE